MNIQELEAFWWIAQTGSFNRAAERLYLTQPSVTARIQVLEKDLGQMVFERNSRGVRLTSAGRALLPHAERILTGVRKARQAVGEIISGTGGTLTIGSALVTSPYTLPKLLSRYRSAHPRVEINLRTGWSQQVHQMVQDDTIQLGLVHAPALAHPDIQAVPVFDEELVIIAHPDHPLVRGQAGATVEQLAAEPFVTPNDTAGFLSLIRQFWNSIGLVPRLAMELESIEATKQMVVHNLGLATLPITAVEEELASGSVAVLRVVGAERCIRQAMLIYRRNKIWSGVARSFLNFMTEL